MHCYFIGSVLKILSHKIVGGSPEEAMKVVWKEVLAEYTAQKTIVQFTTLGVNSFTDSKKKAGAYPRLSGSGSEIKGLVRPLAAVWRKFMRAGEHDNRVAMAFDSICHLQRILDDNSHECFIPMEQCDELKRHTDLFLEHYSWLGVEADRRSECLFTAAPKLHWAWHMADRCRYLNPRKVATWTGEDFVKHTKRIAVRSCAGTPLHAVPLSVMGKYRWGLHIDMVN